MPLRSSRSGLPFEARLAANADGICPGRAAGIRLFPGDRERLHCRPDFWTSVVPANSYRPRCPGTKQDAAATLPRVWGLTSRRLVDRQQILNLAEKLGWPFEEKPLRYSSSSALGHLAVRVGLTGIAPDAAARLGPPWPDFVIASGKRSVPVARWIRRRSGGNCRLIHIGPPRAPLGFFDLVITTPQQPLPHRHNVLTTPLTLNWVTVEQRCQAACRWLERLSHLPRPRTAVLIDGGTPPYVFDRETARRLASGLAQQAVSAGGSLMVAASSPSARNAICVALDSLAPGVARHVWSGEGANPYAAYLAFANRIVATGDSAAMLSEACMTGKSVQIFELPERSDIGLRIARRFRDLAKARGPTAPCLFALYDRLVDLGLVAPARDTRSFQRTLIARELAVPFGETDRGQIAVTSHETIDWAAWRVRRLRLGCATPDFSQFKSG